MPEVTLDIPVRETLSKPPIEETPTSVKYLGVEVPKARPPEIEKELVPPKDSFQDFINTKESLEMQQAIALGIVMRQPIHLRGRPGVGKTDAPKKMAAELGYKVVEINGHGHKRQSDFFGESKENKKRTSDLDPMTVFVDGPFTKALRIPPGEKMMIIVNEVNAIPADVLKILNGLLGDFHKDNAMLTLERDDGLEEHIPINNHDVVLVFTSNDVKAGTEGIMPLSADFLRRVSTHRLPTRMSKEDYTFFALSSIGAAPSKVAPGITEASFLTPNKLPLSIDELKQIPGFIEAFTGYIDFHNELRDMLDDDRLDTSAYQETVDFSDMQSTLAVREFMSRFCPKDDPKQVLPTLQRALRFIYANKLDGENRDIVEEMIDMIENGISGERQKEGLEDHFRHKV